VDVGAKKLNTVTVETPIGGTLGVSKSVAIEGEAIVITPTPFSNYKLGSLKATYMDSLFEEVELVVTDGLFIMPDAPVTIKATFNYEGGFIVIPPFIAPSTFTVTATSGEGGIITPANTTLEKGKEITLNIVPDKGFKIEDVKVNDKSMGPVSSYTILDISSNMDVVATFKRGFDIPPMDNWMNPFMDISEENWYFSSVRFVSSMGLFTGTGNDSFSPMNKMTRGMLVTVLYRFDGNNEKVPGYFMDVDLNQWYANGVVWAAGKKIVNGFEDDTFRPNDNITREQLAVILYRYGKYAGYNLSSTGDISVFKDSDVISSYALESIKWAVNEGLITGKGEGILDPRGEASRAEVATILMRFIMMLAD